MCVCIHAYRIYQAQYILYLTNVGPKEIHTLCMSNIFSAHTITLNTLKVHTTLIQSPTKYFNFKKLIYEVSSKVSTQVFSTVSHYSQLASDTSAT